MEKRVGVSPGHGDRGAARRRIALGPGRRHPRDSRPRRSSPSSSTNSPPMPHRPKFSPGRLAAGWPPSPSSRSPSSAHGRSEKVLAATYREISAIRCSIPGYSRGARSIPATFNARSSRRIRWRLRIRASDAARHVAWPVSRSAPKSSSRVHVLFLATFAASAFGMFLLVRELTGSGAAAFVAGLAFGFAPYRFGAIPHLQVLRRHGCRSRCLDFDVILERNASRHWLVRQRVGRAESLVRLLPPLFQSGRRGVSHVGNDCPASVDESRRADSRRRGDGGERDRHAAVCRSLSGSCGGQASTRVRSWRPRSFRRTCTHISPPTRRFVCGAALREHGRTPRARCSGFDDCRPGACGHLGVLAPRAYRRRSAVSGRARSRLAARGLRRAAAAPASRLVVAVSGKPAGREDYELPPDARGVRPGERRLVCPLAAGAPHDASMGTVADCVLCLRRGGRHRDVVRAGGLRTPAGS